MLQFDVCCKNIDQNFDCGCDCCAILRLDSLLEGQMVSFRAPKNIDSFTHMLTRDSPSRRCKPLICARSALSCIYHWYRQASSELGCQLATKSLISFIYRLRCGYKKKVLAVA